MTCTGYLAFSSARRFRETIAFSPFGGRPAFALAPPQFLLGNANPRTALVFFRDSKFDGHLVRNHYSSQYNEMERVLDAYIMQLSSEFQPGNKVVIQAI